MLEERVKDVNDYVAEGDDVQGKSLEIDRFDEIKLSAKNGFTTKEQKS